MKNQKNSMYVKAAVIGLTLSVLLTGCGIDTAKVSEATKGSTATVASANINTKTENSKKTSEKAKTEKTEVKKKQDESKKAIGTIKQSGEEKQSKNIFQPLSLDTNKKSKNTENEQTSQSEQKKTESKQTSQPEQRQEEVVSIEDSSDEFCDHEWVAEYTNRGKETIEDDADKGHYESIKISDAIEFPVFETHYVCCKCYEDTGHKGGILDTLPDGGAEHMNQHALANDGGGETGNLPVIVDYIHWDAVYDLQWIPDDEKSCVQSDTPEEEPIFIGYRCSKCGWSK